jgi:DNA polymerase III epsilon subunit-like protein
MTASAPSLSDLLPAIRDAIAGCRVVIYNKQFDVQFLPTDTFYGAIDIACCMLRYAEHVGQWNDFHQNFRWHKLVEAAEHVGHRWNGAAHRALADTLATRSLWRWMQGEI